MTSTQRRDLDDGADTDSSRPPVLALVVVGLIGLAVLGLFLRSAGLATGSIRDSLLDEDEAIVGPGPVTFDLAGLPVAGTLDHAWVERERCPGWIQLNSTEGDATTIHVIATDVAPDMASGELVPVDDYPAWLAEQAGVAMVDPTSTTLLGAPAVSGRLQADPDTPDDTLLVACRERDGTGGSGIRGPAAGFEQELVVTTEPVGEVGSVLVLGAAWVGGDIDLARTDAATLARTLRQAS